MEQSVIGFKKFTDTIAVIASLAALVFALTLAGGFEPTDKLPSPLQDPVILSLLAAAGLFLASAVVSLISRRAPTVSLAASLIPIWFCFDAYSNGSLGEQPMLFILMSIIHLAGCAVCVAHWMLYAEDPRRQSKKAETTANALAVVALALWLIPRAFFPIRIQLFLRTPCYLMLFCGLLCGVLCGVWCIRIKREIGDSRDRFWSSVSAVGFCIVIFLMRSVLSIFGL